MNAKKILSGFSYFEDFITLEEEQLLLDKLSELSWQTIKMYNKIAKRRVVHFGLDYLYANRSVTPTTPPPLFLRPFIKRASSLIKIAPEEIAEILITEYPVNAGIGWHKDAPLFDKIFGISLNNTCTIKFRTKCGGKYHIEKMKLAPRSAYLLTGASRTEWQHSIPAVKNARYSITFRTLRAVI